MDFGFPIRSNCKPKIESEFQYTEFFNEKEVKGRYAQLEAQSPQLENINFSVMVRLSMKCERKCMYVPI